MWGRTHFRLASAPTPKHRFASNIGRCPKSSSTNPNAPVPSALSPNARATPLPRLLVELPSRRQVFAENLRDLIFPPRIPPLEIRSAPAPFWSDVFVER